MPNDPKQSAKAAKLRENFRAHPLRRPSQFCRAHFIYHDGVCQVCKTIEEKDRELAAKDEQITMLKGTIDDLSSQLRTQNNRHGW
jgi:hypothetical protein